MEIQLPSPLTTAIEDSRSRSERIVILTCGIAGSGKSTLAKQILRTYPGFVRLSIDAHIYTHHGACGRDYPAALYEEYQDEAHAALITQLKEILGVGVGDMVLDMSFWEREEREIWRGMVPEGMRVVTVYFDATEDVLWRRIEERKDQAEKEGGEGGDAVVHLKREVLAGYVKGFEKPAVDGGEGEVIVVEVL